MRKLQHRRNFSRQKEVDVCSYPFGGWNNSNLFYPESTVRFYDILLVVFCVLPIANLTGKKLYRLKNNVFIVLIKFLDGRKPYTQSRPTTLTCDPGIWAVGTGLRAGTSEVCCGVWTQADDG